MSLCNNLLTNVAEQNGHSKYPGQQWHFEGITPQVTTVIKKQRITFSLKMYFPRLYEHVCHVCWFSSLNSSTYGKMGKLATTVDKGWWMAVLHVYFVSYECAPHFYAFIDYRHEYLQFLNMSILKFEVANVNPEMEEEINSNKMTLGAFPVVLMLEKVSQWIKISHE